MVSQEKSPETLVSMANLAPLPTHPKMPDRKGFKEGQTLAQEGLGCSGWRNCAPRPQSHRHRANGKGGQRKEPLVPRYLGNLLENKKGTCLNLGGLKDNTRTMGER